MKPLILSIFLTLSASPVLACETFGLGNLTIEQAWTRATIGTGRPAVFYVEITNSGDSDDALIGITTPAAGMPMLHETIITEGVASMAHVKSVPVPAGQTVRLAPGGYHGMLMGLTTALKEGENFPVTLTFQAAGAVTIDVEVLSLREDGATCEHAAQ